MFLLNLALTTLAIIASTDGGSIASPNSGSEGDQYQKREGKGVLRQSPVKTTFSGSVDATDRTQQVGPNGILLRKFTNKNLDPVHNYPKRHSSNSETDNNDHRLKRSFYPVQPSYQIQWPQFESLNTWKANLYPIQRPYYVPMYGYETRIPLYYPQFTYYHNVRVPGRPTYVGPTYLPPVGPTYLPPVTTASPPQPTATTSSPTNDTTMMPLDDRFGYNDDDERPIWDNSNPTTPRSNTPTRKPMVSSSTFPPLVHKTDAPKSVNQLSMDDKTEENEVATIPPSIPRPQGPSKCVWAIVSCCSTGSKDVSYECFDQLGCGGPFWDVNPCDTEYAKAAIQAALNYYNSRF